MKKLLSIMLVLAMAFSLVSTAMAAPVAEKYDATSIVNVTGKVESGSYVNLLLLDANNEVKHIQEVKPEADGAYRAKFKFAESTDGLKLQVKQGSADVTDSVVSAVTESEAFTLTFGATTLEDTTKTLAEFKNYFNIEGKTYTMMVAFYDEAGTLIDVEIQDKKAVEFDETSSKVELEIPEGTAKIKSYIWDSVEKMIPLAKEKTTRPAKELKVLAIGNSFTDDPTAYLKPIATADGITLNITKATHGGASILGHWQNHVAGNNWYNSTTVNGETVYQNKLVDYLDPNGLMNKVGYYDIITFQQVSNDSGLIESYGFDEYEHLTDVDYDNCAENLAKLIRQYQPTAEIILQQTWAYEDNSDHYKFGNYDHDADKMQDMINETIKVACARLAEVKTDDGAPISLDGKSLRYIPTGDAFTNAKKNEIFDTKYVKGVSGVDPTVYTLHRDGYHSSHLYGRYLGALVWYGALSGNSPIATTYTHQYNGNTIDANAADILKNAAQDALDAYGRWN